MIRVALQNLNHVVEGVDEEILKVETAPMLIVMEGVVEKDHIVKVCLEVVTVIVLLINFNVKTLKEGIHRIVNNL